MDLSLQSRNLNANFNVNSLQSVYKKKNDQNPDIQYNQQQPVAPNRTKLINSYLPNEVVRESHQYDAENTTLMPSNKPVAANIEGGNLKKLENEAVAVAAAAAAAAAAVVPLSISSLHSAAFFSSDGKKNSILQKPVLYSNETELKSGHNSKEILPTKNKFIEAIGEDSEYSNKLLNQIQCDQQSKKFAAHQSHLIQQLPCLPQIEQKTPNSLMAACKQTSTYQYAQSALKSSLILNNQTVFDQAFHHLNTCNYLQCPKVDLADIHPLPYIPQHFKQQQRNNFQEEDDSQQMKLNFMQQLSTDAAYKANLNHISNELLIRKHTANAKRSSSSSFNETNSNNTQDKQDGKQANKTCMDQILLNQNAANKAAPHPTAENANYSKYTKTSEIADNVLDHYKSNSQISIVSSIQESSIPTIDKMEYSSNISCHVENQPNRIITNEKSDAVNDPASKSVTNEAAIIDKGGIDCRARIENGNGSNFKIQNVLLTENLSDIKSANLPNIPTNTKSNNKQMLQQQNDDKLTRITNEQNEQKPITTTGSNTAFHKEIRNLEKNDEDEIANSKCQLNAFTSNTTSTENSIPANSKEIPHATTCESVNLTNSILKKTLETLNDTKVNESSATELTNNQQYLSDELCPKNTCTNKPCFEEVENKLEEMFAGIEDEPPIICQEINESCKTDKTDQVIEHSSSQVNNLTKTIETPLAAEVIAQNLNTNTSITTSLTTKAMKKDTDIYSTLTAKQYALNDTTPNDKNIESQNHASKLYINNNNSNNNSNYTSLDNACSIVSDRKSNSLNDDINNSKANQKKKRNLRINNTTKNKQQNRKCQESTAKASSLKTKVKLNSIQDDCKMRKPLPSWQSMMSTNQEISTFSIPQNERIQRDLESKHRSPFITIKNDGSIAITNTTNTEDVNDRYAKLKTCLLGRKNVRGLHSSTLSSSYDADKTDSSWICVFCKHGPHKKGLGDLFGPYVASVNCEEYLNAINALTNNIQKDNNNPCKRKRYENAFNYNDRHLSMVTTNSQRRKSCLNSRTAQKDYTTSSREAITDYKDFSESIECLFGMRKISDESYEVWLHEDCAIWAPDIFLVGSEIIGVGSAVWNSTQFHCSICLNVGAMVCCLQRECKLLAHVPCAKAAQWLLDERTLWVYCQKHSKHHNLPSNAYASISLNT